MVRDLNVQDLAFVINVGDLIYPVPAVPPVIERIDGDTRLRLSPTSSPVVLMP